MEARSRRLGLQHGNSVGRAVFLSNGQACRGFLPNEDLPDQKCRCGYPKVEKCEDMVTRFDRMHEHDRQTDGQTDTA